MTKKVTLTQRWRKWCWGSEGHPAEPVWAMSALACMMIAFASLGIHLGASSGMISGIALIVMIATAVGCDVILALRKQWWWFCYWTSCVLIGVILFEIASYFFGGQL